MDDCCDQAPESPLERIAAGLDALPRQLRAFPEIRRELLATLPTKQALARWRPSGDDYGLMWLEMWAYVGDVLGFYDARIADDSYVRTAHRRPELRRIVALLGYTPAGGAGGRAVLAVLAKGSETVVVPPRTAFRSRGFGGEAPQVFETDAATEVHPLQNSWIVEPYVRHPTRDATTELGAVQGDKGKMGGEKGGGDAVPVVRSLLFETKGFGLSKDDLVLFDGRGPGEQQPVDPPATRVVETASYQGKDGRTYVRATFDPPISVPDDYDLHQLRIRRPVQSFVASRHPNVQSGEPITSHFFEAMVLREGNAQALRVGDPVLVVKDREGAEPRFARATITAIEPAAVRLEEIPPPEGGSSPTAPAAMLRVKPNFTLGLGSSADDLTFHHDFVDAGRATNVGRTAIGVTELTDPEGVPITGLVTAPPRAEATAQSQGLSSTSDVVGVLEQAFLVHDATGVGVRLDGRIVFGQDGRASFVATKAEQVPAAPLRLPLTIYGNLVETTRGEQVSAEILGHGDARAINQRFVLKKKPLTHLHTADGSASTLRIQVDGITWTEVPSFHGYGPDDRIYIVRHDDEGGTTVIFGDGERGARLPSGIKNVVASYRFGAGFASPPAGAINQLAAATKGIDGVVSPIAALPGKDPEGPDELRTAAPRRAVLLGRAVSLADFEALAAAAPGVVKASAQWAWLAAQMRAGVQIWYIGAASDEHIAQTLRNHSDPTIALSVLGATPLAAAIDLEVEVDPRYAKAAVAEAVAAHLTEPTHGLLAPVRATIGETFWPSRLYEAVMQVEGVVAVGGVALSTADDTLLLSDVHGTCIPSGRWLDFTAPGAVRVTGINATGGLADPAHGGGT